MKNTGIGIIILAAGLGTRMKSDKAKVLHKVCGVPMIQHVVETAAQVAGSNIVVVVGHQAEAVESLLDGVFNVRFALQAQQLGTGHATLCAIPQLQDDVEDVVILCGDVPLIRPSTIEHLVSEHRDRQREVTLLAVDLPEPAGYGRVITGATGKFEAIVEEADANPAQREINTINTGIYAVKREFLEFALPHIGSDNAQGEIYLTDIIGIGHSQSKNMGIVKGNDRSEIIGVNSPKELQLAENIMKKRHGEIS